jgi:transcription elongation factor Elf1
MTAEALAQIKARCEAATKATIDDLTCVECGDPFELHEGTETTGYCDTCAQSVAALEVPQLVSEIDLLHKRYDEAMEKTHSEIERLQQALFRIRAREVELFEDGLEADLADAGITTLPEAYREGIHNGMHELKEIAQEVLR